MAKAKDINDPASVTALIQTMDSALAAQVNAIRQIILSTDPLVAEQVKWNSPSFFYSGEMKPFDPKEYKRDIIVINTHRGRPLLVFPTGTSIKDTTGLLEGKYTDGRRMIPFTSIEDIDAKADGLTQVIKAWIEQVER